LVLTHGEALKALRRAYGITPAELAKASGITSRELAAIERSLQRPVDGDVLVRLADALQVPRLAIMSAPNRRCCTAFPLHCRTPKHTANGDAA
jgi:transcriptional regulator with XRE-family HTH domain